MKSVFKAFFLVLITFCTATAQTNQGFTVYGLAIDEYEKPYSQALITIAGSITRNEFCNDDGEFTMVLKPEETVVFELQHLRAQHGFALRYTTGKAGETDSVILVVKSRGNFIDPVTIMEAGQKDDVTQIEIDIENIQIPNPSGDVATIIKTLPGVFSNNELSTQYSVRGGNYDENLVYINGIEIYRPFLIRSGQQEGLSIVNTQMIESISFSAGGFDASYGDKLSSVLDITYRKPKEHGALFEGSLLGGSATVFGKSDNNLFTYMLSGRYRSNQYLLNSLDVQGSYRPVFADVQSYISYRTTEHEIGLLSYYGKNRYLSVPESQQTKFGTVKEAFQIDVYYDGQELTQYNMLLNALVWNYTPFDHIKINFSSSFYTANESEQYDVLAQYFLSQLDNRIGSEGFGDPRYTLGAGSYLNHARNFLNAYIFNVQHNGKIKKNQHTFKWGARFQHDIIDDKLVEWRYLDSAGYSVPRTGGKTLELAEVVKTDIDLRTSRFQAHFLDNIVINKENNLRLNAGVRANYWSYNNQFLVSPRISFGYEPNRAYNVQQLNDHGDSAEYKRNIKLKAATGLYQQPPFYRELRSKDGRIIPDVKAQQSLHLVTGAEWNFELWQRETPFIFNVEAYYKYQWNMIPYEIENVRIRYLPEYTATGSVTGIDMQVNGEFIPELPSWFTLSLMRAREDIIGDTYVDTAGITQEIGSLPKPTDQRYSFNILFQDFLKNNEDYRVHLNLVYAHGLPFGPPGFPEYRNYLRIPPYRRVDVGFTRLLYDRETSISPNKWLKKTKRVYLSVELFNAFGIRNTISYLWVRDIYNRGYAVPSYLTSRRINLQLRISI
ncbi:MAG: TonB-dependent receptor plug domain-containing protein [Bacteroidetes bacterium]|nr:TonB-dependent receptor plug domain-containing protein [Bacteroidota bacterium]